MDPKEVVAFQRRQLKKRLRLDEFRDMGDMIKDEDLVIAAEQAKQRKK